MFRGRLVVGAVGERILDLRGHHPPSQIGTPILVFSVHHRIILSRPRSRFRSHTEARQPAVIARIKTSERATRRLAQISS
jgi:hypothetical protein